MAASRRSSPTVPRTKDTARMRAATTTRPQPNREAAAPPKPMGVAELVRRLAETESRLQNVDRDRAADAELIGNLLAEVADRDRRLRQLEAQAGEQAARTRELEETLARAHGVFDEVLRALRDEHRPNGEAVSDLHELLAVSVGALELTRGTASSAARKIEDARLAIRAPADVEAALDATLGKARRARDGVEPVDRAIAQVVDRLRDLEHRERELGELRDALQSDARALVEGVTSLRTWMEPFAGDEPRPSPRKKPSRLPAKKRSG